MHIPAGAIKVEHINDNPRFAQDLQIAFVRWFQHRLKFNRADTVYDRNSKILKMLRHTGSGLEEKRPTVDGNQQGYGTFLLALKNSLTIENIRMLITVLDFKPAERDKVERSEDPGQLFIHSLREKGIISEKDVSTLTDKLKFCGLHGVAYDVIKSFTRYQSNTRLQRSNLGNYEDKKSRFKEQLRIKYKYLCGSIQAVPFLRDKYEINELFIESGIEFLEETRAASHEQEMWTRLKDYKMIFTDPKLKSKRRIIEGELGYGKSTLALQMTHDWCQGIAPMKDFEVLILLRLRYLKNAPTVYSAVKSFLLPKDTELTEDNIKNILDTSQIVVILDGYDEYPDKEKEETDIEHIIRGDMFQEYEVILFTRKSCLPLNRSSDTKRIRLTGFDESARDIYIRKVVARGNAETADHINHFLRDENKIPNDLCKIPLFFTMIANMAHKNETFYHLKTVARFSGI